MSPNGDNGDTTSREVKENLMAGFLLNGAAVATQMTRVQLAVGTAIGIAAIGPVALAVGAEDEGATAAAEAPTPPPTPAPEAALQIDDPKELLERFPPFTTTERIPTLEENGYYPCSDCHGAQLKPNLQVRKLEKEHRDVVLVHGGGRYWCTTCHGEDRDSLVSLKGKPISFDQPFLLCGQCHFDRQRDYFLGGHGKRIGNWQGEKKLAVCTDCHDAHNPKILPKKPQPPPKLRVGLGSPSRAAHRAERPWDRHQEGHR
jgi:hypothetical protein